MKDEVEFCLAHLPDHVSNIPRHTSMTAENIDGRYFNAGDDLM
jgi:hypothetical protein